MYAPKPTGRNGYTVIELMIVVTIISLAASMTVPGLIAGMADKKASMASRKLLLLGKKAQAEAHAYRRAHVLYFNSNNSGTVRLIRGMHGSCLRHDWEAMGDMVSTTCGGVDDYCLWEIKANEVTMFEGWELRVREPGGATEFALCYTPSGVVWHSDSLTTNFQEANTEIGGGATSAGGGYRLTVEKLLDGAVNGVTRTIILPLGGTPRLVR